MSRNTMRSVGFRPLTKRDKCYICIAGLLVVIALILLGISMIEVRLFIG